MIEPFILVVMMVSSNGYTTVAMQEFFSKASCEAAANAIASKQHHYRQIFCVRK